MAEVMKYRLRAVEDTPARGECSLSRTGLCLRVQLRASGVRGRVELWLAAPGKEPICVQAAPAEGTFVCDRGTVWMGAFPQSVLVICEGKPCLVAGAGETEALCQAVKVAQSGGEEIEEVATVEESGEEETVEVAAVEESGDEETLEVMAVEESAEAPPETPEVMARPQAPEEAQLLLPWDLSREGIEAQLTRGEAVQPFPGMMEGAQFVRMELEADAGLTHHVAGRIPLSGDACYYLLGIPGEPGGVPQGAAAAFNHYLPGRDGAGYWVKYVME